MAKIRLQYDLLNGPFVLGNDDSQMPSNVAPDATVLNVGTTSYPVLIAAAGNVINIRGKTTTAHTSGDVRNIYNRLYLYGSVGGESLRTFTSVMSNLDTAHGAHISLNFDATAGGSECSGLGAAVRGTLHIPNIASWAPTGTLCAGMFEIYSDGDNSDPAGLTELSLLRLVNAGGAGTADVDDDAFLFSIQGFTAGTGDSSAHLWSTGLTVATLAAATSCALRIKIGGTTYWIPVATAI